jgi:hypothetical protein
VLAFLHLACIVICASSPALRPAPIEMTSY